MMPLRKSYFVSLDKQEITDVYIPDTTELEIKETENKIEELNNLYTKKDKREKKIKETENENEELNNLIKEKDKREKNAVEFLIKPFNEWGADDEREAYDDYLISIYDELYKLGTPETKQKIKRMRIKE